MMEPATMIEDDLSLSEALPPMVLLLAGIPVLTAFAMTAVHYVAAGTL